MPKSTPRGPAVGTRIPPFEARDQSGRLQTFASIRGPAGAVIVFIRSADW
jgi:peroxiredoxin